RHLEAGIGQRLVVEPGNGCGGQKKSRPRGAGRERIQGCTAPTAYVGGGFDEAAGSGRRDFRVDV
ncbi:hypothetical protein, partial [Pseudomonas aeruginosa]|uniref:hypothetical protein n=1 Tax=Pseudomonas aeruginosa TaxID=287 RepID=UPI00396A5646